MFDKMFFDELEGRIQKYFQRYPTAERVAVFVSTNHVEYLVVEIIEYDERFITFSHWPRENADLPRRWDEVRDSLAVVIIPYEDIRAVMLDPKTVREREIGFQRRSLPS